MRTPEDVPRRLPRASRRTRVALLVVAIVAVILLVPVSGLARFWTDYLWFQSVGFTSVFRGVLLTKLFLALAFIAIFFVLLYGNLWIADRLCPEDEPSGAEDELAVRYREIVGPRRHLVRIATSAVFALLAGTGANREWNNWDLLRYHVSFGVTDPEYHRDVGFYVFELPFIRFVLGWTFEALIVVLIVTSVAHYLNGGISFQSAQRRVTPAVKAHLSVLLAALAMVKAVDYYFQRFELVLARGHVVDGATATSIHADKPARTLLVFIALIAAALFLVNIYQRGWMLPAVGVALWGVVYVLVGAAYPALYQALRVNPSELTREAPYIQRNIQATRAAYGLDKVKVDSSYQYSPTIGPSEVDGGSPMALANQQTLANVRLLDPDPSVQLANTFEKYQGLRQYYGFNTLSVDRYVMDSSGQEQLTATVASVRELNTAVPHGFVNQHLEYTHGYGAVLAPIGESGVNPDGTPDFTLSDLPPTGEPALSAQGSQIYFGIGSDTGGYVIADSKTPELDYENISTGAEVTTRYTGRGGVAAGGFLRRLAFAVRFRDPNFVLSGQINSSSRVLYIRNVVSRVEKAAPFLRYDSDPYAVVVGGNVYWIIDAYTVTGNYPYSQSANTDGVPSNSGLSGTFNYVRNSVKVVVSAYDGSMHFFVVDSTDPIIRVYEKAFPDLFVPVSKADSIVSGITAHFRYPYDLFTVQSNMYGRYHLTDAADFYTQAQAWVVSQDPGSGPLTENTTLGQQVLGSSNAAQPAPAAPVTRLPAEYILAHPPGSTQQTFMLLSSFVPVTSSAERQNLTAFMTAASDPWDYGQLTVYETPPGQTVDGPFLISNAILSNTEISSELSLLDQKGSIADLGEVEVVPLDQSLLYVQPIYVESSTNQIPTLKDVVVVYDGRAYHSDNASLDRALCQITNPGGSRPFSSYCNTPEANSATLVLPTPGATGGPTTTVPTTTTLPGAVPAPAPGSTVASLLSKANAEFAAAADALKAGNLAAYQADVNQAHVYVEQAQQLASAGG